MLCSRLFRLLSEDHLSDIYEVAAEYRLRRDLLQLAAVQGWPAIRQAAEPAGCFIQPEQDDWLRFASTAKPAQLVRVLFMLHPTISEG
jgi:hypothetical protein